MLVLLLLVLVFVPAFLSKTNSDFDCKNLKVEKAIIPMLLIAAAAVSLAVGIYTFLQMRKMQKKNRPKAGQIDGTIADEGVSFCDIAGSPHIHPNITDLWNKKSEAIKQKSGGFLGIGKTSQVTGYRYYTSFAAFIGNRIEKFIAINFDNRGWIVHEPSRHPINLLPVNKPSLFGQDEGGVVGNIDLEFGYPQPQQNLAYKQHFDLVSAYPYQSYLVFRGNTIDQPFYFGNSNYMKEMLLWVKRTRVRNDGQGQWYEVRGDGAVVCEIWAKSESGGGLFPKVDTPHGKTFRSTSNWLSSTKGTYEEIQTTVFKKADSLPLLTEEVINNWKVGLFFKPDTVGYDTYSNDGQATWWIAHHVDFNYSSAKEDLKSGGATTTFNLDAFDEDRVVFFEFFSRTYMEEIKIEGADWFLSRFTEFGSFSVAGSSAPVRHAGALYLSRGQTLSGSFVTKMGADSDGTHLFTFASMRFFFVAALDSLGSSSGVDINPIHKIREILTDDTAMGKPESDVNDANFIKAADRIYDEGLGVSWAIDEKPCIDAIEELCYHIEAGIRVNRQSGLYEMVLFRDDWFAEDEIHTIAENKIKDLSLEVMNSDDIVNQLNVTYYDRKRIKNSTFSVYENGSILTMGHVNAESIDFPYFMNMRNAEIVANWKLKQYSTPAWKGTFTTGWREARKWNRYDLVKINWSKKWQGTILARIMKIDLGNGLNNEVMIDFEEVVPYSGEMNTSIVVDDSTEIKPMPPQSAIFKTFEIPYYDLAQLKTQAELDLELARNPNIGFVAAVAGRPQQNSLDAQLHTESSAGYELVSNVEYASFARTDDAVNRTQQSFVVKNEDLSVQFRQDSLIMLGDEIVIYKSYDAETKTLTVERGALDTIPQNHIENTVLYFYDDAFAYDPEGYTPPKTVNATVLTTTPSGIESLETSPKRQIEIESRAIRPYPPANVKINGEYFPNEIEDGLVLTWAHRNRLQQTGGVPLGWYESSVTLESGVEYVIELYDADDALISTTNVGTANTATVDYSSVTTVTCKIKLYAVRDGYESFEAFEYEFIVSFNPPHNLNGVWNDVAKTLDLTWDFD